MRAKKSNIRDVARSAGVSIATVSRVLNGTGSFTAETVRNVEQAAKELDYRRSTGSIVRRKPGTLVVELVVSDIDLLDPFTWELVRGLYDTTELSSCGVSLRVFRGLADDGMSLSEELSQSGVAGAIFLPYAATSPEALRSATAGRPLVFLERTLEGRPESSVVSDGRDGAYQAVRHLIELGHRSIAYLGAPPELGNERVKRDGFIRALNDEGIASDPARVIIEAGVERSTAREALAARLKGSARFTALLCGSDLIAFGAKEALDRAGVSIPGDISLIGFGDIPFSAALGLTTVGAPAYDMGRNALLLLLDHIQGRLISPKHLVLSTRLLVRSTCRRVRG